VEEYSCETSREDVPMNGLRSIPRGMGLELLVTKACDIFASLLSFARWPRMMRSASWKGPNCRIMKYGPTATVHLRDIVWPMYGSGPFLCNRGLNLVRSLKCGLKCGLMHSTSIAARRMGSPTMSAGFGKFRWQPSALHHPGNILHRQA
jgi:hypothetical protein